MQFKLYHDINEFYDATYDLLMRDEAQNNIMLGNLIRGKEGKGNFDRHDPAAWLMATVSDDSGLLQLVVLMTPPKNITLYARDNIIDSAAVDCLIKGIDKTPVPGVVARKDMGLYFAEAYCAAKRLSHGAPTNQRIYELTRVNPDIPRIGVIRPSEESDMYFLPYWIEAFNSACVRYGKTDMNIPQEAEAYLDRIAQRNLFLLEEQEKPVSIDTTQRELRTVCCVTHVYTPPYFRNKGYASSCVAQLSQMILDRGFTKAVLYTDMENPTSNSIYQKIGYRPVCDSVELKFVSA